MIPIAQFPDWLASVHRVLPFHHMAVVIRDALSTGIVTDVATSYVMLGLWPWPDGPPPPGWSGDAGERPSTPVEQPLDGIDDPRHGRKHLPLEVRGIRDHTG